MDLDGLERLASDPANVLMLCNPHNPADRAWTHEELEAVRDICQRHGVTVISDEIHNELTMPGYRYVPYGTVDRKAIVCVLRRNRLISQVCRLLILSLLIP